jgi:hypothetical protein
MSTYKEISGTLVQKLSTDPPTPYDGQIWYNEDSGFVKFTGASIAGAWSTGNNMGGTTYNHARAGTQTAALAVGGASPETNTESYDGTSWTALNPTTENHRAAGGAGTQTSALVFGGRTPSPVNDTDPDTESWNGTSWTAVNDMNVGMQYGGGVGSSNTAALRVAGGYPLFTATNNSESWNGTNWTATNPLNNNIRFNWAIGTETSALTAGGPGAFNPTGTIVEYWDGTSWTVGNSINAGYSLSNLQGFGTTSDGTMCGGSPNDDETYRYDGTSWTSGSLMNDGRDRGAGAGASGSAGVVFGRSDNVPGVATTEEYNSPAVVTARVNLRNE